MTDRDMNIEGTKLQTLSFRLTGISPLLMHNDRLADPLDEFAREMKKITSKKKKTDEDHEALARLEFLGGLYYRDGVYMPLRCIEATIRDAAKMTKRGKDVQRAITAIGIDEERARFIYAGPKDAEALFNQKFYDRRTVRVQMARNMRTRPKFNTGWQVEFDLAYDEEIFNEDTVIDVVDTAGRLVGLCDYRPRYGRFTAEVV